MKAVILSLRPQWCEKIFNGEKTIEVRKTAPKLETPFTVYVYQTKIKFKVKNWQENFQSIVFTPNGGVEEGSGKVIGSFVCDRVEKYRFSNYEAQYSINDIDQMAAYLNHSQLIQYGKGNPLYGWHISDLKIYDKPKELGEFYTLGNCEKYDFCNQCKNFHRGQGWLDGSYCDEDSCLDNTRIPVTRAPQSWCYVEELL